jgi:hypothetical protein
MALSSGDRIIVIIEQRVTATAAFDALNKTIDSIAKLQYFLTISRALVEK